MSDHDNRLPTADWAQFYIDTFGLALVPIEPGEKGPKGKGWNKPGGYFTESAKAAAFWEKKPRHNLGVVLRPSRVCSLDVDDVQWTRRVLYDLLEIDLDAMALVFPTVVGNPARFRIMFRVPDGVELSRVALAWPNEKDPDGSIHKALTAKAKAAKDAGDTVGEAEARAEADEYQRITVFELRGGLVQDVLPPSIHPGTGKPYTWRTPPSSVDGLPVLAPELLKIWTHWDIFKRDAEAACPWAPKPKSPPAKVIKRPPPAAGKPSVIDEFNRSHDVEELLRAHDYIKRGSKWLYPHSSTGMPGVTISDEGKVYSHHGADLLLLGLVSTLDGMALATYCEAVADWQRFRRRIAEMNAKVDSNDAGDVQTFATGAKQISVWRTMANDAEKRANSAGALFGFSPAARRNLKPTAPQGELFPNEHRDAANRYFS